MVGALSDWIPHLDPSSPIPLYEQILESVVIAVAVGELEPGDRLPSVRVLASRLRLNPNTTARALRALERARLAVAERGVGMRVTEEATRVASDIAEGILERELAGLVATGQRLRLDRRRVVEALCRAWDLSEGQEKTR